MDTNVQYQLREAIAYFEDAIRESDAIIDQCSPRLAQELTDQKQHFLVALAALQISLAMAEERRKGTAE